MSLRLTMLSTVVSLAAGQCDETFPDGTPCGAEDFSSQPDPLACWKYYECDAGCVKHLTCEENYKYDIDFEWCTFPRDVECGDRPCDDPVHCPEDLTTTTEVPDCSPPDQIIDCRADEYGPGYYPDEYNCRKFWHCFKGESHGEHIMCPQETDKPEATMFDTAFMGCNFPEQTNCGGRPICDECNTVCVSTPTNPPDCIPDDEHIKCEDLGPGWFPDEFNCRGFWHCFSDESEPEHRFCPQDSDDPKATMFNPRFDGCTSLKMFSVVKGQSVMNAMIIAQTPLHPLTVTILLTAKTKVPGGMKTPIAVSSTGTAREALQLISSVLMVSWRMLMSHTVWRVTTLTV